MTTTPFTRFYLERRGDTINMIFPVPQRHQIRAYPINRRRNCLVMEPVHTPWGVLPIGKETAKALAAAFQENQIKAEFTVYDNGDWFAVVNNTAVPEAA